MSLSPERNLRAESGRLSVSSLFFSCIESPMTGMLFPCEKAIDDVLDAEALRDMLSGTVRKLS